MNLNPRSLVQAIVEKVETYDSPLEISARRVVNYSL